MNTVQQLRSDLLDAAQHIEGNTAKLAQWLHDRGWRKCVGEAIPPPPGPTLPSTYDRAAQAIEQLAQCMKEDQSLRLLGTDDAEVKGLTLLSTARRTTKF